MKDMTWDDFYAKFYDLAPSTQRSYSYRLINWGPADEVYEVICEFAMEDESFATRFASKALDAGVRFSPDHVMEMPILLEEPIVSRMAVSATGKFTKDQLEEIYSLIDDSSFEFICKKSGVTVFDENIDDEADEWDSSFINESINSHCIRQERTTTQRKESIGTFFRILGAIIAGIFGFALALISALTGLSDGSTSRNHGRCNGDCSNCPAHYGYRYGRWYYGHGHQHGCQRGGNGGASGRTYRD